MKWLAYFVLCCVVSFFFACCTASTKVKDSMDKFLRAVIVLAFILLFAVLAIDYLFFNVWFLTK